VVSGRVTATSGGTRFPHAAPGVDGGTMSAGSATSPCTAPHVDGGSGIKLVGAGTLKAGGYLFNPFSSSCSLAGWSCASGSAAAQPAVAFCSCAPAARGQCCCVLSPAVEGPPPLALTWVLP
jgi:hypothetical protein